MIGLIVKIAGRVRRLEWESGPLVIGRSPECDLQLADGSISRRHCVVAPAGDGWMVRDLGSTNGVRFDGQRIDERSLADGDVVQVGDAQLQFVISASKPVPPSEDDAPAPAVSAEELLGALGNRPLSTREIVSVLRESDEEDVDSDSPMPTAVAERPNRHPGPRAGPDMWQKALAGTQLPVHASVQRQRKVIAAGIGGRKKPSANAIAAGLAIFAVVCISGLVFWAYFGESIIGQPATPVATTQPDDGD